MLLPIVRLDPEAEAGQAGREGGHPEGKALQRGIAPGFIIGREQGQVQPNQQIVIFCVEHSVRSVQIGRHKVDLHAASYVVREAQFFESTGDHIVFLVHQDMGNLCPVGRAVPFQLRYEILVGPVISGGNEDEGLDGPPHRIALVQFGKRVDKDINPFVPVLVPSADTNQDGILRDFFAGHGCGYFQEFPTSGNALVVIFRVRRGCKAVLESVGRHDSNFPFQKMGAFPSGDFADRREGIGLPGGNFLDGMPGDHTELPCLFIPVVQIHRIIERQVVSGQASTDHGSMGRQDSGDRKFCFLQIEQTRAGLPFVELCHDLVGSHQIKFVEALDRPAGCITEKDVLLVVPVAGDRVHAMLNPEFRQDFILLGQVLLEINQDSDRIARNIPLPDPKTDPF